MSRARRLTTPSVLSQIGELKGAQRGVQERSSRSIWIIRRTCFLALLAAIRSSAGVLAALRIS